MPERNPSRRNLLILAGTIPLLNACQEDLSSPEQKVIDLDSLPQEPPSDVLKQMNTVLTIQGSPIGDEIASAVKIDDTKIITARHVYKYLMLEQCRQRFAAGKEIKPVRLKRATVSDKRGSYTPDMMLIETQKSNSFADLPNVSISHRQPQRGDSLFYLNYQSDSKGNPRGPSRYDRTHNSPAFYGGIMMREAPGETLLVLTNIRDYSKDQTDDTIPHDGATGGPVFNKNGDLVGIHVSHSPNFLTTRQIKAQYGITVNGATGSQSFIISRVEPLTRQILTDMRDKLSRVSMPHC